MHLFRSSLVQPLDDEFRDVLDAIAKKRGWPTSGDPARLGEWVRELSEAYNSEAAMPRRGPRSLAARLLFSFVRDVPKGAAAVRELVQSRVLALPPERPLRVLDIGAGLGATSRGIARALGALGGSGALAIDAVDDDGDALDLAATIARARPTETGVTLELHPIRASVHSVLPVRGPYDLIVLGQVLSELGGKEHVARRDVHLRLVESLLDLLAKDGSLVLVEPALRDRTRQLHALRDALVTLPDRPLHVFAPCVHDAPCPALAEDGAWCHEDLDVDLPSWLVPIARAAGLRFQGLTFSYLVLRRYEGAHLRNRHALRVVSAPIVTKGKREQFLCGSFEEGALGRRLVTRLDRHKEPGNATWDETARGDTVVIDPPLSSARPRIVAETLVRRLTEF